MAGLHKKLLMLVVGVLGTSAFALDLRNVTKDLYYECRTEASAGIYRDPSSDKFVPSYFKVDVTEKWEMRLVPIRSKDDLTKRIPNACLRERSLHLKDWNKSEDLKEPEFCRIETSGSANGKPVELVQHCLLTPHSLYESRFNALNCGLGDTHYFDTDRLYGLNGQTLVGLVDMGLRQFAVSKYSCQRLDR